MHLSPTSKLGYLSFNKGFISTSFKSPTLKFAIHKVHCCFHSEHGNKLRLGFQQTFWLKIITYFEIFKCNDNVLSILFMIFHFAAHGVQNSY